MSTTTTQPIWMDSNVIRALDNFRQHAEYHVDLIAYRVRMADDSPHTYYSGLMCERLARAVQQHPERESWQDRVKRRRQELNRKLLQEWEDNAVVMQTWG